ncbi:MAG: hypothetical protein SCJ97_02435 [Bacillota bacterium]|nr:hypothetical protein [Bacillota bacterium]
MESIITLIIIVVLFNLFNIIMRVIKGAQNQPSARKSPVVEGDFTKPEGKEAWAEELRELEYRLMGKFEEDRPVIEAEYIESEPIEDEEEEIVEDTPEYSKPESILPVSRTVRPSALELNLKNVLTRKDPLVAAFIFSEILGPPHAIRKKR